MAKRSKEHIRRVDEYLKTFFPLDGADLCAVALCEDTAWIRCRASMIGLRTVKPRKSNPRRFDKDRLVKQVEMMNEDLVVMIETNIRLRAINKQLRKELIKGLANG